MKRAFTPSAFLFCDFASEDTDGRTTIAGIHPGLGNYRSIRYFPRFVAAVVHPLAVKSDLHMRVVGPSGLLKLKAGFEGDSEPSSLDQLTFIIPLHRLGPAAGHYEVLLGSSEDSLEVVCEFELLTVPKPEKTGSTIAASEPKAPRAASKKRKPSA